jgi:hypothetical protein
VNIASDNGDYAKFVAALQPGAYVSLHVDARNDSGLKSETAQTTF